jgi:hypothetical protein
MGFLWKKIDEEQHQGWLLAAQAEVCLRQHQCGCDMDALPEQDIHSVALVHLPDGRYLKIRH